MNANEEVIVHSHPRSGLHLMLLGLYVIYGGDTAKSYNEIWHKTDKMPSYRHFQDKAEEILNYNKHILLLRNFSVIASTASPGKLDKAMTSLEANCTNYQYTSAGPYGLNMGGYAKQIKDFDTLPPGKEKLVVYYEDLIKDGEAFRKIVSFIGKKEHTLTEDYDFKELRSKAREFYRTSGHTSSQKIDVSIAQTKRLAGRYEMMLGTPVFEKYLGRYNS